MTSPSMRRISTDKIVLEDAGGNRSEVIQAVVEDRIIHIGSDSRLPVKAGNKIIHLRPDGSEAYYIIQDYEVHSMKSELYYVITVNKDVSPRPKWMTKQAPEKLQQQIVDVIRIIEQWIPKQRYRNEETYEAALAEHLVGRGIEAPEQQGKSLTDILALHEIGIEVKLTPSRDDYDRLSGQIIRQLEEFGAVVVLIVRPDKLDLLEEYKARFDNRVAFVIK